jgi:acetyl esterase/lipase
MPYQNATVKNVGRRLGLQQSKLREGVSVPDGPFTTVTYSEPPTGDLTLDVFRPEVDSRHSAVLIFHGGGWRAGAKEAVHQQAAALAAAGFTGIAVQYRLLDIAPWPAQLADARAALSWVRSHAAELSIDPTQVVAQGHSAGAHLALMTGTVGAEERPAAVVAYYPATGFYRADQPPPVDPDTPPAPPSLELDAQGRIPSWMLFPPGTDDAELIAASPISVADAAYPPTILLHATQDTVIGSTASIALHRRLCALGVPSDLHIYADRGHGFDLAPSMLAATVHATTSFLERMVTNRRELDAEAEQFSLARLLQAQPR